MTAVSTTGWLCLGALALQFGLHPFLATAFLPRQVPKPVIVLATELAKLLIAAAVVASWTPTKRRRELKQWRLLDSLQVAALPACLYSMQNVLIQIGYYHVDSMTFNILNQTKVVSNFLLVAFDTTLVTLVGLLVRLQTLSAAFWVWLLLGKRQSRMQIVALGLLLISAVILNLPQESATDKPATSRRSFMAGVVPILAASLISGLSSALSQWALQNKSRESFVYNLELAVYSLLVLLMHIWWNDDLDAVVTAWRDVQTLAPAQLLAALPILSQAFGGLLTGLVAKHTDTTLKGFALIAGLLITCITQAVTGTAALTSQHLLALACVSAGIYLHATFPPKPQPSAATKSKAE